MVNEESERKSIAMF